MILSLFSFLTEKRAHFFPKTKGGGWPAQTPDSYSDNFSKPPIRLAKTTTAWYNISEGIFTEVRLETTIAF